jgi:hypothetical protein
LAPYPRVRGLNSSGDLRREGSVSPEVYIREVTRTVDLHIHVDKSQLCDGGDVATDVILSDVDLQPRCHVSLDLADSPIPFSY